jgi:hypothetical protein
MYSWVFSTETPASQSTGHPKYNPATSGKKISGATWKISYQDGSGASGDVYADKVVVGPVTATSQAVEAATQVSAQFTEDTDNDGLLGLAFSTINTVRPTKQTTFFDTVKSTLKQKLFAVDLKKGAPSTPVPSPTSPLPVAAASGSSPPAATALALPPRPAAASAPPSPTPAPLSSSSPTPPSKPTTPKSQALLTAALRADTFSRAAPLCLTSTLPSAVGLLSFLVATSTLLLRVAALATVEFSPTMGLVCRFSAISS